MPKSTSAEVRVLGIRHHGPGSAKRLQRVLDAWSPDLLLVELPADATPALHWIGDPDLVPPVALLIYQPQDLSAVSILPFAHFSPEWLALQHAQRHGIPVVAMDLPQGTPLAADPAPSSAAARDPLHYLASLAGYTDSERWWEKTFEDIPDEIAVFAAILELLRTLRLAEPESRPSTLCREAHMRKCLRQALRQGYQRIAVICGAWHAPALADWAQYPPAADKALLQALPTAKTRATWIPWSDERLARQSGYGAGVVSPAWYALLFAHNTQRATHWLVGVVRLLRQAGMEVSPAHAQEAVRLAEALAAIRNKSLPGLEELEEAALAVMTQGQTEPLELIRSALIIGRERGRVPAKMVGLPLHQDLEKAIQAAGLKKAYQAAEPAARKELDLRKPTHRQASQLLHRLQVLGIGWGAPVPIEKKALGTFHEWWELSAWEAEHLIRLIEKSSWGNTVVEAATRYSLDQAKTLRSLPPLLQLFGQVLKADLPAAVDPLVAQLQAASAATRDVELLMEALPPLAQLLRYGDVRQTTRAIVLPLLHEIVPRLAIAYPAACRQLAEPVAQDFFALTLRTNQAFNLLRTSTWLEAWDGALAAVVAEPTAHPLLAGLALRLLADKEKLTLDAVALALRQALSPGVSMAAAAGWLEGFLHGNAQMLLHHAPLWQLLDAWILDLPEDLFRETLPIMRRAFSQYSPPERAELLRYAQGERTVTASWSADLDQERAAVVNPLLRILLADPATPPETTAS